MQVENASREIGRDDNASRNASREIGCDDNASRKCK
jgi:hypothetical protein